jgi:hypothetical protein
VLSIFGPCCILRLKLIKKKYIKLVVEHMACPVCKLEDSKVALESKKTVWNEILATIESIWMPENERI